MKTILHTKEFKTLYNAFDRLVCTKGYKTGQGKMYQVNVKQMLSWMEKRSIISVDQIRSAQLKEYLDHLITRPNKRFGGTLSVSTINHHLFSFRLFFEQLLDTGYCTEVVNVPRNLPRNYKHREALSEEEVKLLYKTADSNLERAVLSLSYGCGLRRSEIQDLNIASIVFSKGLLVAIGKGNKVRDVAMSETVIKDLKDYLFVERMDRIRSYKSGDDAFFLNGKGKRLSGDHINKTLKAVVERTGDMEMRKKKVSLHTMRHSIATHLVDRGMKMLDIREFLGHSELDTTSIYMYKRKRRNKHII